MRLSDNIPSIRKQRELSQADLIKMIEIPEDVIDFNEQCTIFFVEIISQVADELKTPFGYVLSKTKMELAKQIQNRLVNISTFLDESKRFALNLIDMALRDLRKNSHFLKFYYYSFPVKQS